MYTFISFSISCFKKTPKIITFVSTFGRQYVQAMSKSSQLSPRWPLLLNKSYVANKIWMASSRVTYCVKWIHQFFNF
jgi:hypothetical protein